MREIWVPVVTWIKGVKYDFTGYYEASSLGRIRSLNYNKTGKNIIMTPWRCKSGYLEVKLSKGGTAKNYLVHRIVWCSFNGKIEDNLQVNHINEIKTDNRISNLNLMSPKENTNWGDARKKQKKNILCKPILQFDKNGTFIMEFSSSAEIERLLGYNHSNIRLCCTGNPKYKTPYGYIWKYK